MKEKWPILQKSIAFTDMKTISEIIACCAILHNLVILVEGGPLIPYQDELLRQVDLDLVGRRGGEKGEMIGEYLANH